MADGLWYMKFDVTRWQRDLDEHPLEIKGAWITICCKLWWASKRGELTLHLSRWATILRVDEANTNRIINYLENEKICDTQRHPNGYVTVMSRKMLRDDKDRELSRLRQRKHRSNANVTQSNDDVTPESKSKSNIKSNKERGKTVFIIPTIEEIKSYCRERNNQVDPQSFLDHYTSNGWMVGKNKMKDWKASARTWEKRKFENVTKRQLQVDKSTPTQTKEYQLEEMPQISEAERKSNLDRVGKLLSSITKEKP